MNRTNPLQWLSDRVRQGLYGLALTVAVGSLWAFAWANEAESPGRAVYGNPAPGYPRAVAVAMTDATDRP